MRYVLVTGLLLIGTLTACGDDEGDGGGGGASGGMSTGGTSLGGMATGGSATGGSSTGGSSTGGMATGGMASGGGGAGTCFDPGPLAYGMGPNGEPDGCLTFQGASELCGFQAAGEICGFAIGCGLSTDMSQCQINCEMGTTVLCYEETDVDCLIDAYCANDCTAAEACGFIL